MPFIKKVAVGLWANIAEYLATGLKVAMKSLFFGPVFYGMSWLIYHHAPSHETWYGFFCAAYFFTSAPKKIKSGPNKEEPQQPSSPIILPASHWRKSNDHHA